MILGLILEVSEGGDCILHVKPSVSLFKIIKLKVIQSKPVEI